MKGPFRVLLVGGSGNVGQCVLSALLRQLSCQKIFLLSRQLRHQDLDPRVKELTSTFEPETLASEVKTLVLKETVDCAVSCLGIGSGSASMSEEEVRHLEIDIVGAFAQGCQQGGVRHMCLLSSAGANEASWFRYTRLMGLKEEAAGQWGFDTYDVFRPGIIGGNSNTPAWVEWLGSQMPIFSGMGTIQQIDIGMAIANRLRQAPLDGGMVLDNAAMLQQSELFMLHPCVAGCHWT